MKPIVLGVLISALQYLNFGVEPFLICLQYMQLILPKYCLCYEYEF